MLHFITSRSVIWFIINYLFDQERATNDVDDVFTRHLPSPLGRVFPGLGERIPGIKFGLSIPSARRRKETSRAIIFIWRIETRVKMFTFIQILKGKTRHSNLAPFRLSGLF